MSKPLYCAPKTIWREVLRSEEHRNPGFEKSWAVGGSIRLFLVCGHEVSRKLSQGVPRRTRCRDCERVRGGSVGMTRDLKTNLLTVEDWDPERNLPRRITRPMTTDEIAEWNDR